MGYDNTSYLGIKVSAYNPSIIKDIGFFFTVHQKAWELSDEDRAKIPKKRTMKTEVLQDFYYLPEALKKHGFNYIFNNIVLKKSDRVVKWKGPYGETNVDVFESYFSKNNN